VFELRAVAAVAREQLDTLHEGGRVQVLEGDFLTGPIPTGHDLVVASTFHAGQSSAARVVSTLMSLTRFRTRSKRVGSHAATHSVFSRAYGARTRSAETATSRDSQRHTALGSADRLAITFDSQ
jgi:hypothetical protein